MTARAERAKRPTPTVVIVDDDPVMIRATQTAIRTLLPDVETRAFVDPHLAFNAVLAEPPCVVLTDYEMPRCTGPELAAALRQSLGADCPRLALLTGADVSRATLRLFDVYFAKPFQLASLIAVIEPWLAPSMSGVRALSVHDRPTEPPDPPEGS